MLTKMITDCREKLDLLFHLVATIFGALVVYFIGVLVLSVSLGAVLGLAILAAGIGSIHFSLKNIAQKCIEFMRGGKLSSN